MLLSLKGQNAIHHMFQNLRPGDGALLVDVADDEDGHALPFRQVHQRHRALLHLTDAAGQGVAAVAEDGLDGVHNHDVGPNLVGGVDNGAQTRLREHVELFPGDAQPLGAQLNLPGGFLTGDV